MLKEIIKKNKVLYYPCKYIKNVLDRFKYQCSLNYISKNTKKIKKNVIKIDTLYILNLKLFSH